MKNRYIGCYGLKYKSNISDGQIKKAINEHILISIILFVISIGILIFKLST